jgi:hypothetical protein
MNVCNLSFVEAWFIAAGPESLLFGLLIGSALGFLYAVMKCRVWQ